MERGTNSSKPNKSTPSKILLSMNGNPRQHVQNRIQLSAEWMNLSSNHLKRDTLQIPLNLSGIISI